jgi:hypothetical protein
MRELNIGSKKYTKIIALDDKGIGNANHRYSILISNEDTNGQFKSDINNIVFQNGAIKENGVNGCHNEDLISIVIDRLHGFQSGEFSCRENAIALTKLEEAMMWLNKRTNDRILRGVEGTSIK